MTVDQPGPSALAIARELERPRPLFVTFDVWTVPAAAIPRAAALSARGRTTQRRAEGLVFHKVLGTGDGRTFTVRDATPRRWALLCVWASTAEATRVDASPVGRAFAAIADEHWHLDLRPLAARGRWSRRRPLGQLAPRVPGDAAGPVVAITRARLSARGARRFLAAVPPVAAAARGPDGPRYALGIGELPVGLQGTVSLWDDEAALLRFARGRAEHVAVVERTARVGWYAEEFFARFALTGSRGTVEGRDPAAEAPDPG